MSKEVVRTEAAPAPFQGAPYSQAIKANGFVFVSGQLSLRPGDKELSAGEIGRRPSRSSRTCAILEAAGSSLDTAREDDGVPAEPRRLRGDERGLRQHVGEPPPARSTVEVAKLPSGALVEIEAIAVV